MSQIARCEIYLGFSSSAQSDQKQIWFYHILSKPIGNMLISHRQRPNTKCKLGLSNPYRGQIPDKARDPTPFYGPLTLVLLYLFEWLSK